MPSLSVFRMLINNPGEEQITKKIRWGMQSPIQTAFFIVWEEVWYNGEVVYASVIYSQNGLEPYS